MAAWERARAEHTARTGLKRKGAPPKPRPIPPKERQRINLTDPDSRPVKTARGFIQGYTAQAVTTEEQVIVAADVITGGNERGQLGPMAKAAERELENAGVEGKPEVALADAGYWNAAQRSRRSLRRRGSRFPGPAGRRHSQGAEQDQTRRPLYQRMRERLARPEAEAPTDAASR